MFETAGIAFATLFTTVSPISVASMFAGLTAHDRPQQKRRTAYRGVAVATGILLVFAFFGETLLAKLGISIDALRTAGGILLLLIAIDMVFARASGAVSATAEEKQEAEASQDIAVFPLATPLIAGPGAMGAAVLLMAGASGNLAQQATVIAVLVGVMAITLALLLAATHVQRLLGVTGMHVLERVLGVLLSAMAVQFIFDGIKGSGLVG